MQKCFPCKMLAVSRPKQLHFRACLTKFRLALICCAIAKNELMYIKQIYLCRNLSFSSPKHTNSASALWLERQQGNQRRGSAAKSRTHLKSMQITWKSEQRQFYQKKSATQAAKDFHWWCQIHHTNCGAIFTTPTGRARYHTNSPHQLVGLDSPHQLDI